MRGVPFCMACVTIGAKVALYMEGRHTHVASYFESSELAELAAQVRKDYEDLKAKGLKLDLTRGKPAKAQLDLSMICWRCPARPLHRRGRKRPA